MKDQLQQLLKQSLTALVNEGVLDTMPSNIYVTHAKDKDQGDFVSNLALIVSKQANLSPIVLAQKIVANIKHGVEIDHIDIAGPGFINFFLSQHSSTDVINRIIDQGDTFGSSDFGKGKRLLLEFVSANPTGPLHVGHGRGAAYGATVSNLLHAIGFEVDNEYYVNNAGRQIDILATSVYLRYVKTDKFPDSGYQGEYITKIAKSITKVKKLDIFINVCKDEKQGGNKEQHIDELIANCKHMLGDDYKLVFNQAIDTILKGIKDELADFGVEYQQWFKEKDLIDSNLSATIKLLQKAGHIYEKGGALWFKTTEFGDDLDRVVIRDNGMHTYFASDIAYHLEKLERGYDKIINIWGADHHGYIARIKASIKALGFDENKLQVLLVQFANLFRGGVKVPMSTRSGSFVTLATLRQEVGNDAARFFYVLRKSEQSMDFDIDLAKSKTNENPVFYIQYAHARICSVLTKTQIYKADLSKLNNAHEQTIIKTLNRFTDVLQNAAINYEPHLLAYYLRELASDFHSYYNHSEFLIKDSNLKNARLTLINAVKQVLTNGLKLLGVSSPEKM